MSNETLKVEIIKKAWEDPEFKARLLADPAAALQESFGIKLPQEIQLITVEETWSFRQARQSWKARTAQRLALTPCGINRVGSEGTG